MSQDEHSDVGMQATLKEETLSEPENMPDELMSDAESTDHGGDSPKWLRGFGWKDGGFKAYTDSQTSVLDDNLSDEDTDRPIQIALKSIAIQKYEEALRVASWTLKKKYHNKLNIWEGARSGHPFLHVSSKECTQGLDYLSAFYVIITCEIDGEGSDNFHFNLLSYHGKKLTDLKIPMNPDLLEHTKLDMLEDLATDNLHVCQGIQELRLQRWRRFCAKAKLTLLEKVKTTFFIEPLEEDLVLRSRSCKYAVRNFLRNDHPEAKDYIRCESCSIYQKARQKTTLFMFRKMGQWSEIEKLHEQEKGRCLPEDEEDCTYEENEYAQLSAAHQGLEEERREESEAFTKSLIKPNPPKEDTPPSEQPSKEKRKEVEIPIEEDFRLDDDEDELIAEDGEEQKSQRRSRRVSKPPKLFPVNSKPLQAEKLSDESDEEPMEFELKSMEEVDQADMNDEDFDSDMDDDNFDADYCGEHRSRRERLKFIEATETEYFALYLKTSLGLVRQKLQERQDGGLKKTGYWLKNLGQEYLYQCTACLGLHFGRTAVKQCIQKHQDVTDLSEKVSCPQCPEETSYARGLLNPHFEKSHPGQLCCIFCFKMIQQEPLLSLDPQKQISFSKADNLLRRHILRNHHEATPKSHFCGDCGLAFSNICAYNNHVVGIHKPEEKLVCQYCSQKFPSVGRLTKHIQLRHPKNWYKCLHCDKKFGEHKDTWRRHLATHHPELRPFKCALCSYSCVKRSNMPNHFKSMHKGEKVQVVADEDLIIQRDKICKSELKIVLESDPVSED